MTGPTQPTPLAEYEVAGQDKLIQFVNANQGDRTRK